MDRPIEKRKGLSRKHLTYGIGILVGLVILFQMVFADYKSTYKVDREKLMVATVERGQFDDYIKVIGRVEPISTVYLSATEGGRVEEKVVEEGVMVEKGDVIVRLSSPELNIAILNSEAQLAEKGNFLRNTLVTMEQEKINIKRELLNLEFDIRRKKRAFEQNKVLYKEELVSREDYLQSQEFYEYAQRSYNLFLERQQQDSLFRSVQIKQMRENLDNMRRNLELVRQRQENLNIKAPVSGQLGLLDVEIGQTVGRGGQIGQINVLTSYKVVAEIDEHYIDRVKPLLEGNLDRQGRNFHLRVKKVYPEVREGKFEIDLVFNGELPVNIRTGQTYHLKLRLGDSQEALLVPKGGFFSSTGGRWVYVISQEGGEAYRRSIRIGKQNPSYYEVLEGLEPGEEIVVSSYDSFGENERLVIK